MKATEGAGLLIDPSDPTASVVYTKLTMVPPFGSRMPLAGMPADDTTLACVLAWISANSSDAGPLDDGAVTGAGAEAGADAVGPTDARADTSASGGGVPEGGTGVPESGARDSGPRDAGHPDAASNSPDAAQDAGSG